MSSEARATVEDRDTQDVAERMRECRILLVDVREEDEVEEAAFPDAFVLPLSRFDAGAIPDPAGREVVFACRAGHRSATAALMAQAQGFPYRVHMDGGIIAWLSAGLPTA